MAEQVRYWDTGPFLAWLKPERHRLAEVEPLIEAAEAGRLRLVTSSVTLIEVVKLDERDAVTQVPPEDQAKIREFFDRSYISVRAYDRRTATLARQLIWDHNLTTRDAMHLATAWRWRLRLVETFDVSDFLPLDGRIGDPPIQIRLPLSDLPVVAPEPPSYGEQIGLDLGGEPPIA